VDRLIALVALRWRLDLRAALGARSRLAALLVALPALALLSLSAAFVAFSLARLLEARQPQLVLPALSAVASLLGLSWALAPLVAGVAATETHDLGRLLHYPAPLATLVGSSLVANLLQPVVLAQLPPLAALSLGLAGAGPRWPVAGAGLLLSLGLALAAGQCVGLALHALSRQRRWHDRALLAGIGLGLVLSLLPLLLLSSGGAGARGFARELLARDFFALLPFSWGARAAVHAARGEALAFLSWAAGAALAIAATVAVSSALAQRLYRGELDLGEVRGTSRRARLRLPGTIGALVEKDLRTSWRDPRLKALVFSGVVGPALVLVALWQGAAGGAAPGLMLALASFAGLGVLGANVFGSERQGVALLLGFPVDRTAILVAKNLAVMVLRLPALLLVALATLLVAGPALLPAAVAIVLATQLVAAALDNFVSVLAPTPLPGAGRDPGAPVSGVRGLGAAAIAFASMAGALLLSAPFAFLAWLPHLLAMPWLWLVSLPLCVGGAAGVYFMLASGAARVLAGREPEIVARVSGEA
jgi:ABC-2 type transport system permease protein